MAKRRSAPKELPDAVRDAVERTMLATGDRAQGAVDDVVDRMRGAEASLTRSRRAVAGAVEDRLPATQGDIRDLKAELRRIGRRLDAIEERLPARRQKRRAGSS